MSRAQTACAAAGVDWQTLLELAIKAAPYMEDLVTAVASRDLGGIFEAIKNLTPIIKEVIALFGGNRVLAVTMLVEAVEEIDGPPKGFNIFDLINLILQFLPIILFG